MAKKKVLITGSSGLIGGIVHRGLADKYDISGVDIRPADGITTHIADMRNLDAIQPAFEDVDAVVDLAAIVQQDSTWDDVYTNNFPATYNAFEAARRAGVKRIVFASSNHTAGMWEFDPPYKHIVTGEYEGLDSKTLRRVTVDMPIRPDGPYGIGKAFGEATGRVLRRSSALLVRGRVEYVEGVVNVIGEQFTELRIPIRIASRDFR